MRKIIIILILSILATSCRSLVTPSMMEFSFGNNEVDGHSSSIASADIVVLGNSLAGWSASIAAAYEVAQRGDHDASVVLILDGLDCIGGQATCAGVSQWDALDDAHGNNFLLQYSWKGEQRIAGQPEGCTTHQFCPDPDGLEDELRAWLAWFGVRVVIADDIEAFADGSITVDGISYANKIIIEASEDGSLIPNELRRSVECQQPNTVAWGVTTRDTGEYLSDYADYGYADLDEQTMSYLRAEQGDKPWFHIKRYRHTEDLDGHVRYGLNYKNDHLDDESALDLTKQQLSYMTSLNIWDGFYVDRTDIAYNRTSEYRLNAQSHVANTPRGVDTWADSVAVFHYRGDSHGGCSPDKSSPYGEYDFPISACIPADGGNLIVAMPRSCDVSDIVSTSARMQPDELEFGQVAGIAAAFAHLKSIDISDVNVNEIRSTLVERRFPVDVK
jgi:hypothetical protein